MNGINHVGSLCMLSDSPNNVSFYRSQGVSHSTSMNGCTYVLRMARG